MAEKINDISTMEQYAVLKRATLFDMGGFAQDPDQ